MNRSVPFPVLLAAVALAALTLGVTPAARAQVIQSGDTLVGGNNGLSEPYGESVIWRLRNGTREQVFHSGGAWYGPEDIMIDRQGRVVFIATPTISYGYDRGLYRGDPVTGSYERLMHLPNLFGPNDTIPEGLPPGIDGFYNYTESLHMTRSFGIVIDDDVNGGLPQGHADDAYEFAMPAHVVGNPSFYGTNNLAIRYLPGSGTIEMGTDLRLLVGNGNPASMFADGSDVYYGLSSRVEKATPDLTVKFRFHVGNNYVAGRARVAGPSEQVANSEVIDNTEVPNQSASCYSNGFLLTDDNDPIENGGFYSFTMNLLGVLGGKPFVTTSEGTSGWGWLFDLAPRGPYLNPGYCAFLPALQFRGTVPFYKGGFGWTGATRLTVNGGRVLFTQTQPGESGRLVSVDPSGSLNVLATDIPFATGVAIVPNTVSTAQVASSTAQVTSVAGLVVRADANVRLRIRDPQGRFLGQDAGGTFTNDFGSAGAYVSVTAEPESLRVYTLMNPQPGNYYVQIVGTADGAYTLTGYLAETSVGGTSAAITGQTQIGVIENRAFHVTLPNTLVWLPGNVGVAPGPPVASLAFSSVHPIPSSGDVNFDYRVPEPGGHVRLQIYDLLGRRVSSLVDEPRGAGAWNSAWNGVDASGRRLRAGVYLARLTMDGLSPVVRRIVLER